MRTHIFKALLICIILISIACSKKVIKDNEISQEYENIEIEDNTISQEYKNTETEDNTISQVYENKENEDLIQDEVDKNFTLNKEESDFQWPKFSIVEYEKEREFVREYFGEIVSDEENKELYNNQPVEIAIALEDINGDGEKDILVVIVHRVYAGYNTTGVLGFYLKTDGNMKYIPISQVFFDETRTEEYIGIRESEASNMVDFLLNDNIWIWNEDEDAYR